MARHEFVNNPYDDSSLDRLRRWGGHELKQTAEFLNFVFRTIQLNASEIEALPKDEYGCAILANSEVKITINTDEARQNFPVLQYLNEGAFEVESADTTESEDRILARDMSHFELTREGRRTKLLEIDPEDEASKRSASILASRAAEAFISYLSNEEVEKDS